MMKYPLVCNFKKPYKSMYSSVSVATKIANMMIHKWGGGFAYIFVAIFFVAVLGLVLIARAADEHITSYVPSKQWNADSLYVDRGGNIGTLTTNSGTVRLVEVNSGGNITNYTVNGGTVSTITINSGGQLSLNHAGGVINTLNLNGGIIPYFENTSGGGAIKQTINNMNVNDGQIGLNFGYHLNGNINNLNINKWTIAISSDGTAWGTKTQHTFQGRGYTGIPRTPVEHIYLNGDGINVSNIAKGGIIVGVGIGESGSGAKVGDIYEYSKIIAGGKGVTPNFDSLTPTPGIRLIPAGTAGFSLEADVASSYGITILKTITLSYMRKNTMVSNVLDSLMKKNFRSTPSKANQPKIYEQPSARTPPGAPPRYAPQMRKLATTSRQTRGKTRLEKKFLSYEKNKNHIGFFAPYGGHSYFSDTSVSRAHEFVGGGIGGIQRNLGQKGILGGYLGYEYSYTLADVYAQNINLQTHSMQVGATYFNSKALKGKSLKEFYFKGILRGDMSVPFFETNTYAGALKTQSFNYGFGTEARIGTAFYQEKAASYIAPELGVSYDLLILPSFYLNKEFINQANEDYPTHLWHFPQINLSLRGIKSFGKSGSFRMFWLLGGKYNILNTQEASFKIANLQSKGDINLPIAYANLDLNFVWSIHKNHELTLGYGGIYFVGGFSKQSLQGFSNALSLKYGAWF